MMNFWISLYVSIVITVFGSMMIGSSDTTQISRIGSGQDLKILTQGSDRSGPSRYLQQTLPTPPDEQQSQDPGTNLTNIQFQVPDPPPTGTPHRYVGRYPRWIPKDPNPIENIDQSPREMFVRPQRKKTTVPHCIITLYTQTDLKSTGDNQDISRHPEAIQLRHPDKKKPRTS